MLLLMAEVEGIIEVHQVCELDNCGNEEREVAGSEGGRGSRDDGGGGGGGSVGSCAVSQKHHPSCPQLVRSSSPRHSIG